MKVPKNLPKINPPSKATGLPKPAKKIQIIVKIKKTRKIKKMKLDKDYI